MKNIAMLVILVPFLCMGQAPAPRGKIVVQRITFPSLQNPGGEDPTRRVTIYLPPDYDRTTNRYPVLYYLHGFTWSDSLQIASDHFDLLLDKAIANSKIRPVIVVIPNHHTAFRGSWYTNSSLTGNWADFTAKDLVTYIDGHYRTIPSAEGRGITGHSMGGYGALKMGMLFPDVFSTVYALSPATLGLAREFAPTAAAFRRAQQIDSRQQLVTGYSDFLANAVIAMGRAFSPNPDKPPFYADLPFAYEDNVLKVDYKVLGLWNDHSLIEIADEHVENLKKLRGLKLDWGRNEEFPHIPLTCKIFSQKLENLAVNHYAEEYIGTHGNKLWTDDGRALNDMLPFFNFYLEFEELQYKPEAKKRVN